MTTYYLGIDRGVTQNPGNVAVGTSTTSKDMELAILMTNAPTKQDVLLAIEAFEQYIISNYIPAGSPGTDLPPL